MHHAIEDHESYSRRSGKKYATAYAAKDVQGGTAVTSPPWSEDCCTSATIHMQELATATVRSMYLTRGQLGFLYIAIGGSLTTNGWRPDSIGW